MSIFNPNEYFKNLAIAHVDIAHTEEAPAFFREYSSSKILFDNSEFLSKMRYAKRIVVVSQFNKDGNFFGPHADSTFRDNSGALYILVKITDKNIQQAQDIADDIMLDFYLEMQTDSELERISPENNIKLNSVSIHALGAIADNYYGVVAFINFSHPLCFIRDPKKWK